MEVFHSQTTPSAVVFAYHDVGYRCLSVLLAQGVNVKLVVTHQNSHSETIWFESVEELARQNGIDVRSPDNPHDDETMELLQAAQPDFIFSFYYRKLLKSSVLKLAKRGCYNMHGSLLPKYRGRVPVNWAVLRGESETGATLHEMEVKADAGPIVDQMAVPILPNDTAPQVFNKVLVAAELVLFRSLPLLIGGTATHTRMDLSEGSYFGGRNAEDGRIDWTQTAQQVHNLVRAVTYPYPGAFTDTSVGRFTIWSTVLLKDTPNEVSKTPALYTQDGVIFVCAGDGNILRILKLDLDGNTITKLPSSPLFLSTLGDLQIQS
jgi:methionyl-tRNA formyltransferase